LIIYVVVVGGRLGLISKCDAYGNFPDGETLSLFHSNITSPSLSLGSEGERMKELVLKKIDKFLEPSKARVKKALPKV